MPIVFMYIVTFFIAHIYFISIIFQNFLYFACKSNCVILSNQFSCQTCLYKILHFKSIPTNARYSCNQGFCKDKTISLKS